MTPSDASGRLLINLPQKLMHALNDYLAFVDQPSDKLPPYTPFQVSTQIILDSIVLEAQRQCPEALFNKKIFLQEMASAFDRNIHGKGGAFTP